MQQLVSITSQGQISIPAKMRRALGLDKLNKALVRTEKKTIVVEPIKDILQLDGALKHKAIKGKTTAEIRRLEKEAAIAGWTGKLKKA